MTKEAIRAAKASALPKGSLVEIEAVAKAD